MFLVFVVEAGTCKMDGHIEIELIARRIVVIRIHRNGNPVDIT